MRRYKSALKSHLNPWFETHREALRTFGNPTLTPHTIDAKTRLLVTFDRACDENMIRRRSDFNVIEAKRWMRDQLADYPSDGE